MLVQIQNRCIIDAGARFQRVVTRDTAFNGRRLHEAAQIIDNLLYTCKNILAALAYSSSSAPCRLIEDFGAVPYVRRLIILREIGTPRQHGMMRCSCDCGCCGSLRANLQSTIRHIMNHMRMRPSCIVLQRPARPPSYPCPQIRMAFCTSANQVRTWAGRLHGEGKSFAPVNVTPSVFGR